VAHLVPAEAEVVPDFRFFPSAGWENSSCRLAFSSSLFPVRCDNRVAGGLCRQSLQTIRNVVL
jgi:hypothetical protein